MTTRSLDWSRPATLVLAALVAVVTAVPPETDGMSLAGAALLALLAALLVGRATTLPVAVAALAPAAAVAAIRVRFAEAPGEAILPVALPIAAAAAGLASAAVARASAKGAATLQAVVIAAAAGVGARAVYEAVFGLRAWAESVRSDPSAIPDVARVLGRLDEGRAYAGFPTPAAAGGFLATVLPLTVAWALRERGRTRLLLAVAACLEAAGLIATRSITAAAALLGALALAAVLMRSPRVVLAAGGLLLVVVLFASWRSAQVLSRTTDDHPATLRAGNVRVGLAIVRDHPWIGVGPGGYAEAFPRYRRAGDNESRHAHMTPVEWLSEWGVPLGVLLGVLFVAAFLGPLARGIREAGVVERGVAIGLGALVLQNLADFTVLLPSILVVGCVLRGTFVPARRSPASPGRVSRILFLGTTLSAAILLVGAGLSDSALDRGRDAALRGDAAVAKESGRIASSWAPWSADAALFRSQASASVAEAERAVTLVPTRASAREVRARFRLSTGDSPGAYADLGVAAGLNPMRAEYAELRDRIAAGLPRPPANAGAK